MNIFHITTWYPNDQNTKEAIWIKRHFDALQCTVHHQEIAHLQVTPGKFSFRSAQGFGAVHWLLRVPTNRWFIIEVLSFILLALLLIRKRVNKQYDIINFHIAYPNLTYWHLIKRWIKIPVVITEHWSAYHFRFGTSRDLPRIKRIFRQQIPVITVSDALASDIRLFAGAPFPCYVIANVVESQIFYPDTAVKREPFFFMVSLWKLPKTPITVMESFMQFCKEAEEAYVLKVGGYGPLWSDMERWIEHNDAGKCIHLLGKMDSSEIANHQRRCTAFLHPSDYETFSVVCAEAVSCGALVIAPRIGGIPEVVNNQGILLDHWRMEDWVAAMHKAVRNDTVLSVNAGGRFSSEKVGGQYHKALKEVINAFKK